MYYMIMLPCFLYQYLFLIPCPLYHSCILQHIWPCCPRSTSNSCSTFQLPYSCIPINCLSFTRSTTWVLCPFQLIWLLYSHQLPELFPVNFLSIVYLSTTYTLVFPINYLSCTRSTTWVWYPYQLTDSCIPSTTWVVPSQLMEYCILSYLSCTRSTTRVLYLY